MEFAFSEEQQAICALAHEILAREATPERVKEASASPDWTDEALWKTLAEANLLGVAIPEEHGGMGFGFVELCLLLEAGGRALAPLPLRACLVHAALPLATHGSEAQRAEWLPRIASGEALLTAALEGAVQAHEAHGDFVLAGRLHGVQFAERADAILIPTDGAVWLVEPQAAGVSLERRVTSTGQPRYEIELAGVRVSRESRLAVEDEWIRERALVANAAVQCGVSEAALELTAGYVREREQFGVPIGSFQAVQHRCADAFIDLQALRWTTWRAASRIAAGLPAMREARIAKFWAAEAGARIAAAGVHLHGGLGADVDYPIQRHFLWSKALELEAGGATPTLAALGREMARSGPPSEAPA